MTALRISGLSTGTPAVTDKFAYQPTTGDDLYMAGLQLPSYTVALLLAGTPSAITYEGRLVYVSDGTSNKRIAIGAGTTAANWRFPDGNTVS